MNVGIEASVVEDGANSSVESVHSRIVRWHPRAVKRLPEDDLVLLIALRDTFNYPGVAALSICADGNVCVQTKAYEKVAQQNRMVFRISTASGKERLHRMPHLHFVRARHFKSLERNQRDESRSVKRTVQDSIGEHRLNQGASGLVDRGLAVISLSEDLHQSLLVSWSDLLVLSPPRVGVVEEVLQRLVLILLLKFLLSGDLFL